MSLYSEFFYSKEINDLFSDKQAIAFMLETEAALARAQAQNSLFPVDLAEIISKSCRTELIDIDKLKSEISLGGNAAIPLVHQLTRIVKTQNFEASKYVHFGATSQDIIDTATVLSIKKYIDWLEIKLEELSKMLLMLCQKYRNTPMIGRTLLQQAKPITFGLKAAGWFSGIEECSEQLKDLKKRLLKIQMAGAVGAGNASISKEIQIDTAQILGISSANSWQSIRGSFSEWAAFLGILSGNLGKMAKDISLLMQTEVAEVFEGAAAGKGGSSTMPHKRNPVTCAAILANSTRIPGLVASMLSSMLQEHERSAGLWHAEWETLNDIMLLTAGSVEKANDLIKNLEVDANRMASNLELTNGLIYAENVSLALSEKIGKVQAHEYVEKACKTAISQKKHLLEVLLEQKTELPDLEKYFQANYSLGSAYRVIDEILQKYSTNLNPKP